MFARPALPLAAIAAALLLVACQPAARTTSDATPPVAATPAGSPGATVGGIPTARPPEVPDAPQAWPTSLVLGIGEQVPLGGGTLKLERIAADSRCPKNAQCIWEGEVTLAFAWSPPAGAARAFTLSQRTTPRTSLGDHDVELTAFGTCPAGHTPASAAGCASLAFTPSQMR